MARFTYWCPQQSPVCGKVIRDVWVSKWRVEHSYPYLCPNCFTAMKRFEGPPKFEDS